MPKGRFSLGQIIATLCQIEVQLAPSTPTALGWEAILSTHSSHYGLTPQFIAD